MVLILKKRHLLPLTMLYLLASKGCCQEPKPRYMVKGEAAKAAAQGLGGKIVFEIPKRGITALEFDDLSMVKTLKDQANRNNFEIEEDQIRGIYPGIPSEGSKGRKRRLAESTPWGIGRTYERDGVVDIPDDSHFPDSAVHAICVIDSGYDVSHDDLPDDVEGTKTTSVTIDVIMGPTSLAPLLLFGVMMRELLEFGLVHPTSKLRRHFQITFF